MGQPSHPTDRKIYRDLSFKYSKTLTNGNNEDTYRSELGVLCFISVMVQSDEVKTRFHLVAASAKHVLATLTLTGFRRATGKEITSRNLDVSSGRSGGK